MEPRSGDEKPHTPPPTLWPVGFAVGIACILVGLVVSWAAVAVGAALALVFGFLWVRDVTAGYRGRPAPPPEAERPAPPAAAPVPAPGLGERERFERKKFLEGATLGLGAVIGGVVTVPPVFLAIVPPFLKQGRREIDLGPLSDYPEGQFVIASFLERPQEGEVSRRTAFIRNNGLLDGRPSFTTLSNRCTHLGCPSQPNGPVFDNQKKVERTAGGQEVVLIPTQPAGFGCPCHGSAFDIEGNRTAGPAVRAFDRYEYSIRNGRLYLGRTYSVSRVDGTGANVRIRKYNLAGPGQHVDGWEQVFYPWQPPH